MSAIAAIIEWDRPVGSGLEHETLLRARLARWRADSVSVSRCPGATLGIALLAADSYRSRDRQPFVDDVRKIAVVGDCRFDDRRALVDSLSLPHDASDADLLVAGYERWGDDLPLHLSGDFACVIWDWNRRRCLAFRDPVGVRPLFYAELPRGIVLASAVEFVVSLARPRPIPDDRFVVEHLLWEYSSTDRTFWSSIARLPGGHLLVDGPTERRARRYWRPAASAAHSIDAGQVYEELTRLFTQSVGRRFDGNGTVLAHLSGGLDSSLIVCVADQLRRQPGAERPVLLTVSQRFPGQAWDEGEFIQSVREWTGFDGTEWDGSKAVFLDVADASLAGPGMLSARTSGSIGDLEIAAQKSARVMLSGEGGDQLGATWGLIDDLAAERPVGFAIETLGRIDLSLADRLGRARRLLRPAVPGALRRALIGARYRKGLPAWLQPKWQEQAVGWVTARLSGATPEPFPHEVQRAHWREFTSGRTGMVLDVQQLVAGRHGVEVRYPFFDRDLVEFVLALGPACWPRGPAGTRLHREAMASLLPPRVRTRIGKANFSGAGSQLMKRSERELDILFHCGEWLSSEYVVREEAQDLFRRALRASDEQRGGHERDWLQVRAIASLEAWLRAVFGYAPTRHA